ncbi:hypothetical protein [Patulibacter minatonensis]|uniref:hypothetical protein n=1 Tax=Patulibacter minatonensis TaxID=298163 RepID=UPI000478CB80|nr:hypothetical protein [Patulibacter minatonensis]
MLTAADEWHVHQTSEPIAVSGTDRNFYDRSYFGVFDPASDVMVAVAFGMYPHLNVADAHLTVVHGGTQHCLHASKTLHSDRATLRVGPVAIEIVEPLRKLRVTVDETDGLAADFTVTGVHFPIEEPRFVHRFGPRTFMDYTRLSQACTAEGWVTVGGTRTELGGAFALRDRSWGIRPTGAPDTQAYQPPIQPQFAWLWTPVRLGDRTLFWHQNADGAGRPWNTRATLVPDGSTAEEHVHAHGTMTPTLLGGTRWISGATLEIEADDGTDLELVYTPRMHLEMQGIGYRHPVWSHGLPHGELEVAVEALDLTDPAPDEPHRWHRQVLCDVAVRDRGAGTEDQGTGVLEHLFIGPYGPLGLE